MPLTPYHFPGVDRKDIPPFDRQGRGRDGTLEDLAKQRPAPGLPIRLTTCEGRVCRETMNAKEMKVLLESELADSRGMVIHRVANCLSGCETQRGQAVRLASVRVEFAEADPEEPTRLRDKLKLRLKEELARGKEHLLFKREPRPKFEALRLVGLDKEDLHKVVEVVKGWANR